MNIPHAKKLEAAVLGAVMLDVDVYDDLAPILTKECFYDESHQAIWESMIRLSKKNIGIDMLTVTQELMKMGQLEFVGGAYAISQLRESVRSSGHVMSHARIISQQFVKRELIRVSTKVESMGMDNSVDMDDMFTYYDKSVSKLDTFLTSGGSSSGGMPTSINNFMEIMKKREEFSAKGELEGVTSGLKDLDRITNGWQKQGLYIIAGRPSMGKSALCVHFGHEAAKAGKKVLYFSLEMSDSQVVERMMFNYVNFNIEKFKDGSFSTNERAQVDLASRTLSELPMEIDDTSGSSTSYVKAKIRNKMKKEGCDLVIIDYIQKVTLSNSNKEGESMYNEIAGDLKNVAKTFDIPVILCAQLNRAVEQRGGAKRPQLSDLRDSGAIEQEADFVGFVYRPWYYGIKQDPDTGKDTNGLGMLIVAKHRIGAIGDVFFKHSFAITKIKDDDDNESSFEGNGVINNLVPD